MLVLLRKWTKRHVNFLLFLKKTLLSFVLLSFSNLLFAEPLVNNLRGAVNASRELELRIAEKNEAAKFVAGKCIDAVLATNQLATCIQSMENESGIINRPEGVGSNSELFLMALMSPIIKDERTNSPESIVSAMKEIQFKLKEKKQFDKNSINVSASESLLNIIDDKIKIFEREITAAKASKLTSAGPSSGYYEITKYQQNIREMTTVGGPFSFFKWLYNVVANLTGTRSEASKTEVTKILQVEKLDDLITKDDALLIRDLAKSFVSPDKTLKLKLADDQEKDLSVVAENTAQLVAKVIFEKEDFLSHLLSKVVSSSEESDEISPDYDKFLRLLLSPTIEFIPEGSTGIVKKQALDLAIKKYESEIESISDESHKIELKKAVTNMKKRLEQASDYSEEFGLIKEALSSQRGEQANELRASIKDGLLEQGGFFDFLLIEKQVAIEAGIEFEKTKMQELEDSNSIAKLKSVAGIVSKDPEIRVFHDSLIERVKNAKLSSQAFASSSNDDSQSSAGSEISAGSKLTKANLNKLGRLKNPKTPSDKASQYSAVEKKVTQKIDQSSAQLALAMELIDELDAIGSMQISDLSSSSDEASEGYKTKFKELAKALSLPKTATLAEIIKKLTDNSSDLSTPAQKMMQDVAIYLNQRESLAAAQKTILELESGQLISGDKLKALARIHTQAPSQLDDELLRDRWGSLQDFMETEKDATKQKKALINYHYERLVAAKVTLSGKILARDILGGEQPSEFFDGVAARSSILVAGQLAAATEIESQFVKIKQMKVSGVEGSKILGLKSTAQTDPVLSSIYNSRKGNWSKPDAAKFDEANKRWLEVDAQFKLALFVSMSSGLGNGYLVDAAMLDGGTLKEEHSKKIIRIVLKLENTTLSPTERKKLEKEKNKLLKTNMLTTEQFSVLALKDLKDPLFEIVEKACDHNPEFESKRHNLVTKQMISDLDQVLQSKVLGYVDLENSKYQVESKSRLTQLFSSLITRSELGSDLKFLNQQNDQSKRSGQDLGYISPDVISSWSKDASLLGADKASLKFSIDNVGNLARDYLFQKVLSIALIPQDDVIAEELKNAFRRLIPNDFNPGKDSLVKRASAQTFVDAYVAGSLDSDLKSDFESILSQKMKDRETLDKLINSDLDRLLTDTLDERLMDIFKKLYPGPDVVTSFKAKLTRPDTKLAAILEFKSKLFGTNKKNLEILNEYKQSLKSRGFLPDYVEVPTSNGSAWVSVEKVSGFLENKRLTGTSAAIISEYPDPEKMLLIHLEDKVGRGEARQEDYDELERLNKNMTQMLLSDSDQKAAVRDSIKLDLELFNHESKLDELSKLMASLAVRENDVAKTSTDEERKLSKTFLIILQEQWGLDDKKPAEKQTRMTDFKNKFDLILQVSRSKGFAILTAEQARERSSDLIRELNMPGLNLLFQSPTSQSRKLRQDLITVSGNKDELNSLVRPKREDQLKQKVQSQQEGQSQPEVPVEAFKDNPSSVAPKKRPEGAHLTAAADEEAGEGSGNSEPETTIPQAENMSQEVEDLQLKRQGDILSDQQEAERRQPTGKETGEASTLVPAASLRSLGQARLRRSSTSSQPGPRPASARK